MTTNTNAAQVANNLIAVAEDQAFEAWYKQDCLVGGVNARIAARAAWNARAALTTAAAVPPEGFVMVPKVPDERMERAIAAAFFGTVHEAREAWVAGIAAAPKAEPVQAVEYPPLPRPFIGVQDQPWGGHKEVIRSAIGEDGVVSCYTDDQMRAYIDADRAMRAQAAPAAVAGPSEILEKINSLISSINEAHRSQNSGWRQGCFDAADNTYKQIKDMLYAAPTTQAAPVAQGDAEDARIIQWILDNAGEASRLLDSWCNDRDATQEELHGELARRAGRSQAKEGA